MSICSATDPGSFGAVPVVESGGVWVVGAVSGVVGVLAVVAGISVVVAVVASSCLT